MQPLTELGRHFARVSLIAPQQVIEPVSKSFIFLQSVVSALVNKRWAIEDAASSLDLNQKSTQFMLDRQKNLGERMDVLTDSGEPKGQVQLLYDEHVDISKRIQANLAEHDPLLQRKAELEMAALKASMEMLMPIKEYSLPAFLAIRAEIGLPIDEAWYRRFSEESAQKAVEILTQFQNDLNESLFNKTS